MMRRALLAFVLIVCGLAVARAQTASDQPIMGSEATQEQPEVLLEEAVDDTYRILVIGDALGGGLGAGLIRMAEAEPAMEVAVRFKEESGIARPEVYDWSSALPKILDGNDYDAAVVLLGANDRQSIRIGEARLLFNTPDWIAAYQVQMDRILEVLKAAGVKVFWVSLPPMADADYEAAMQAVMQLQKERAEAAGARFVDIRSSFLNPDGTYTDVGADDTGEIRKLRSRDGVSFFKQGNNRLGQLLLAAIKAGKGPDPAPRVVSPVEQPNVPLFGQDLTGGETLTLRPADVTVADVLTVVGVAAKSAEMLGALRSVAAPGSAAEKLFSLGEAAPAPAGRVDDFLLPQ